MIVLKDLYSLLKEACNIVNVELPDDLSVENKLRVEKKLLLLLNEYIFQTTDSLGKTQFNGEEFPYFSEYHKYWEKHHRDLLDVKINEERALEVAKALSNAKSIFGNAIFRVNHNVTNLTRQDIAQARYFTANQDFRGSINEPYNKIKQYPEKFQSQWIYDNANDFLSLIGVSRKSQNDKRIDFAKKSALFLINNNIDAFGLAAHFNNDAVAIRNALINSVGMGYGLKKTNMFIRDMVELGVWQLARFSDIDVASDVNTMKLALRTGILETDIPIISSFLDQFCHQYSLIDEFSAKAWRKVWELWKEIDNLNAPESPCQIDYLLYRIGQDYCKEILSIYKCETGHDFYHLGNKLRFCPYSRCKKSNKTAKFIKKQLPCQIDSSLLPLKKGRIDIKPDNMLSIFNGKCIFEGVCRSKDSGFILFDPPMSISIKGQTGWTESYSFKGRGGGGMMG